ncbi:hypothetical protein Noda2021_07220 [Candidatus Dependentiae bacterium Noda2021]|nr:hypothetical protein Noda2021_07220 [Candidatus Dependentiae bacterium Noda2021]
MNMGSLRRAQFIVTASAGETLCLINNTGLARIITTSVLPLARAANNLVSVYVRQIAYFIIPEIQFGDFFISTITFLVDYCCAFLLNIRKE